MTIEANPGNWLTARRLRAHGLILALCLWSLYAWNLATPGLRDRNGNLKGTDFLHFYTLGSLAAAHRGADLYSMTAQAALAAQRVPAAAGIRYLPLYPPQLSLLFAPPSHLPYAWALVVWWTICASVYGVCCYCVWRSCGHLRQHGLTVLILAIGFPAFFHLIAWGQTSALALACFTLMFFLLRDKNDFLAGLVLGCLIFKPQLGVAAAVVFLATGAWKTVLGAAISAAAQLGVGILYYGKAPLLQWIDRLIHLQSLMPLLEPKPYQTYSLRTFWTMLAPWPESVALYALTAAAVLVIAAVVWKRASLPLGIRYSALLLATVLVAPHLTVYDLVILAPAFLLLADSLAGQSETSSRNWLGTLLYLAYMLPLVGPFARWTHVQLAVIAMVACLWMIWARGRVPAET
jgi:hypothetical protein